MAEITRVKGRPIIDYMARDYDSLLEAMRAMISEKLPEWQDYRSEADFGNVLLELFAHMGDILSYYQDRVANESFLGTAQSRRSIIQHLRLIGYKLSTAAPASAMLTLTVASNCEDVVTIKRGDAFATKSQSGKPSIRFEYSGETPLTIDFKRIPVVNGKKVYGGTENQPGIPVEEGRLIANALLGQSDGSPNQTFILAQPQLILRALDQGQTRQRDILLRTELGAAPAQKVETWQLQESLAFSREGQRDFVIEIDDQDRATVRFGDGAFGAIPPAGAQIIATYRVGGGAGGNVAAHSIETIVAAPQLALLGAKVTNPQAATGGAERESIEHAVFHAPRVFRSLKRAVTAADYEALAGNFPGVGKVRAEGRNWNTVILHIAPKGGGQVSDVLRANLLAYFEDKRAVSTLVEIADVQYVKIYIAADVGVQSYYAPNAIKQQVQQAVQRLLDFEQVSFKQTLYLSKFYEAIEAIEGVAYVNITEFRRADSDQAQLVSAVTPAAPKTLITENGKIELTENELAKIPDDPVADADYSAGIKVTVLGEE